MYFNTDTTVRVSRADWAAKSAKAARVRKNRGMLYLERLERFVPLERLSLRDLRQELGTVMDRINCWSEWE